MSGYIGTTPVPQATQHREAFTANANQTTFATAGYTVGYIDVWVNGVKLAAADVTVTNGSDIVLASAAAANDIVEYLAFVPFEATNQTFTGATVVNSLNLNGDGATVTGIKDEDNMASNDANKLATQQSIKAYVDAQVTAQDLDFQGDSGGALNIDLDSETLDIAGGTNITTAGSGNTVTVNIAPLDEDNMASNSATQVASQQSIKAYVDTTVGATNEVVEDTTPQLGGDLASNGNDILMADNDKVIVGTGSDLQLYHSGTYNRSYIQATGTNHDLTISADEIALTNSAISETFATFVADGAVTLYYDNAAKLATTSAGVSVTGTVTSGELLSTVGLQVAGHPVVGYASFDSGYATRLGSTGSSTLNATQIYAGGVAQATFKGGNVGIGETDMTTYASKLYIKGSATNLRHIIHNTLSSGLRWELNSASSGSFYIGNPSVNALTITSAGAATFAGTVTTATQVKVSGSNASTVAFSVGDTGTGWYNAGSNAIALSSNGIPSIHVTSGGNVGIGTASPDARLDIEHPSLGQAANLGETRSKSGFILNSDTGYGSNGLTMGECAGTAGSYFISVTNSGGSASYPLNLQPYGGNVGIGTTAPFAGSKLTLQTSASDAYTPTGFNEASLFSIISPNADTNYSSIRFSNIGGNYEHFLGSVQTSSNTADMVFQGYDRAASAYKEYLRITDGGNVGIGTTDPQEKLHVYHGSTSAVIRVSGEGNVNRKAEIGYNASDGPYVAAGSSGIATLKFYVDNTSLAMTIAQNDVISGDFNDTSDVALKENITDLESATTKLKQLKPRTFDWKKTDKENGVAGFIAQEVETVIPKAVVGTNYENSGDSGKAINTTALLAYAIKTIQELEARLTAGGL